MQTASADQRKCLYCSASLKGRQSKFCCKEHKNSWWVRAYRGRSELTYSDRDIDRMLADLCMFFKKHEHVLLKVLDPIPDNSRNESEERAVMSQEERQDDQSH